MTYTEDDYPGKELGYPYNWWTNIDYILNSGNFDIPNENGVDEQPNAKEAALFSIFVPQAIMHVDNSNIALNRAQVLNATGVYTGLTNGKADAFRHSFWNALGTADFGAQIMKLFADAHEWGQSGPDVDMDYHNNHEGRIVGGNFNITDSNSDIEAAIHQAINFGLMVYLVNGVQIPTNQ